MTRSLAAAALAVLATAAAGCGEDGSTTRAAGAAPRAPSQPEQAREPEEPGARLTVASSRFGRVVADAKGEALYLFDREKDGQSECYDACAEAWPPMLAKGEPVAGRDVDEGLLGTTRRRDGKLQVTYRGQPLYYYVGDSPGTILCQNVDEFGGRWLVVKPDGDPVA